MINEKKKCKNFKKLMKFFSYIRDFSYYIPINNQY